MKRINAFSERHPLLSIIAGYLLIVAIAIVVLPADPPSVDAALQHRSNT